MKLYLVSLALGVLVGAFYGALTSGPRRRPWWLSSDFSASSWASKSRL
jgi:hypothetical protein